MNQLRDLVIDAHGGLERWKKVKAIEADMSIAGGLWARKGWPDVLKDVHVIVDTRSQWISYQPFINDSMRSSCTPDRSVIETRDGKPFKERTNPRASFDGHTVETQWDDLNLAYFSGYAMWNYLNTPFIFALQRPCRRRRADGALPARAQGFLRNQDRNEATGGAQKI